MTIFLWTTLILSIITLVIIASPIRFGGNCTLGGNRNIYNFRGSYIHPLICEFAYSSKDGRARVTLLGFTVYPRRRKKKKFKSFGIANTDTERVDIGNANVGDINDTLVAANKKSNYPADTGSGEYTCDDDILLSDTHEKHNKKHVEGDKPKAHVEEPAHNRESLIQCIKNRIDTIKNHVGCKIITDKPLMKKLYKWSKRLPKHLFKLASMEKLKLRIRIGIGDYASLGKLYGHFVVVRHMLGLRDRAVDLSMEPVFTERCLEIDGSITVKTTIATMLWHVLAMLITFPYFRLRKIMRNL